MTRRIVRVAIAAIVCCLLARTSVSAAASVVVEWDASADVTIAGYQLHYGTASGRYDTTIAVGDVTTYRIDNLAGGTYYMIVDGYTADGVPSGPSNELLVTVVDTSDTTPPAVVSVSPSNGSSNVSYTPLVTATFSETIDPSTIGTGTFLVRSATGTLVPGVVSYDTASSTATFSPFSSLTPLTWYAATLSGRTAALHVADLAGNALPADVTFSFTTAPPPDLAPPSVAIVQPASGPVGVLQTIAAVATDDVGVDGVQFLLDGAPIAQEQIQPPYSIVWTTASLGPGPHILAASARDAAGHVTVSAPVAVTVQNATVHVPPGDFTLEWDASSTGYVAGYRVRYGSASLSYSTAIDAGSDLWTTVTGLTAARTYYFIVDAYDPDGDASGPSNELTVVVDPPPAPVVTTSGNVTASATGAAGAPATFSASAMLFDGSIVAPACSPMPGSMFPIGATVVTCSATDSYGSTGSAQLTVSVVDTTPPTIATSGDVTVEAAGPDGAIATFTATAADLVDGTDPVACAPASGAMFAIGVTTVTCSTTDVHGLTASAQLNVTVEDATAPAIRLVAPSADGTLSAVAGDIVGVVDVTFVVDGVPVADVTAPPYQIQWNTTAIANGSHTVTATARDAAGNTASATIKAVNKPK